MSDTPELVLDARARNGENPLWSVAEQRLYWIDVEAPAIHRFDPASGTDECWRMPSEVGAIALCRSGTLLAALRTGLMRLDLAAGTSELLAPPPYDPLTHRFNSGKCDSNGRFWIGTMFKPLDGRKPDAATEPTPLYVFEAGQLRETGVSAVIANGLDWSLDDRRFYFADSFARRIDRYAFHAGSGQISDPQCFASFPSTGPQPDGAAMDSEGCYWSAQYDGGRVIRFRPDGSIKREIHLPVSEPTMCAFAGPDLRDIYITTASSGLSPERAAREPHAGGLFRLRAPAPGLPAHLADS
ncbi:putative gluconolactonase [Sphingomonas changbaiensis NBRC 104936]|uniref:Putative gluconolactonase n=1 Tax=Sphingomonas changbaiensis NBRC 104936 TaxID=1219043 RepID=A0A0E9MLT4_9SPHN|nr:SMP-30/gluconolactonase/LRE family protein [Sphingomonas changbaiensis]GAO38458.1 putative gluconolactonase [Sphingomonas changbaiensis NBRC 104936]